MNYYVHKTYVQPRFMNSIASLKDFLDSFYPPTFESTEYKNWIAELDMKTCITCMDNHGMIYEFDEIPGEEPPIHEHCRCSIESMDTATVGTATQDGINGADVFVKDTGSLPANYIPKKEAIDLGWIRWQGNLNKVAPGMSIGGEIYQNRNGHLPQSIERIWYEADINYDSGFRNTHRLLFFKRWIDFCHL